MVSVPSIEEAPKRCPREAQERPKRGPREAQERPKRGPREPHEPATHGTMVATWHVGAEGDRV